MVCSSWVRGGILWHERHRKPLDTYTPAYGQFCRPPRRAGRSKIIQRGERDILCSAMVVIITEAFG